MPGAYQPYHITDLGVGLDRYHTLDKIPDGAMVTLRNLDPRSNGSLETRKGFEQYYGCLPLRASSFSKSGTTYTVTFDSAVSIDLSSAVDGPIVVAGDLPSDAASDFTGCDFNTSFNAHYYNDYDVSFRETFPSGAPATATKTAAATGISQNQVFVGWFQSDSLTNLGNTLLVPESIAIHKTNYQVSLGYNSPSDITGFFAYKEVPTTSGTIYVHSLANDVTDTITSSEHGLSNDNFIVRCFEDDGTSYTEVTPLTLTANTSGDITITWSAAASNRIAIIYAAENSQVESAVAGSQTLSVSGVTTPFNAFELWATSGGTRTAVTPASITWDADTEIASVEYVGPGAESVEVVWAEMDYVANSITFTGGDSGNDFSTTNPEISVWGICHEGIYKTAAVRGGHTHHIDNYNSALSTKMVTALGGNLMQATSYASGGTTYKMASLTLRGSNRVSGAQVLAPLFTTTDVSRTRGSCYDSAAVDSDGYAEVTGVAYVSGNLVDYTFTFSNLSGTPSTSVSTNDYLTVRNCGRSVNNGTFKISSVVSESTTEVVIRVTNTSVASDAFDESNISAQGNVFTDRILLTDTPVFLVGDIVSSNDTSDSNIVKSIDVSTSNYIFIAGVTSTTTISDGINLYVKRTSAVLPLQNFPNESVGDDTNGGFVVGDSVSVTGLTNTPAIKYINTNATGAATVSISSGVATITLSSHDLNVGQTVCFYASSDPDFEGEFTVASVPTSSTFTVSTSAADGTPTCTMLGKTIEIDESKQLTYGPTEVVVTNQGRWTIAENPKSSQARVLETKARHWDESDFTNQPYTKSVIVNDSMFLVNGTDEVKKFDGTNLYNAGLVPWQGWFFATVDAATTSLEAGPTVTWDNGASNPYTDKYFVIDTQVIKVGDRFKVSSSGNIYQARSVEETDTGEFRVYTTTTIANAADENTSTGTITKPSTYRYYARVNAVDANNNIVASATLGADDLYVEVFTSSAVQLKLGGLPAFAELDHDRLELELYRTKNNTPAPFYRVHRQVCDYSALGGYIVFTDTKTDDLLTYALRDTVTQSATAAELGSTWTQPPLAETVTTVDNSLILGNIKSPPTLDVVFRNAGTVNSLDAADFSSGQVTLQISGTTSATANNSYAFSFENSVAAKNQLTPASHIAVGSNTIDIDNGVAHGLSVGDWIYLFHSALGETNHLDFAGWYRVSATSGTQFSVDLQHNVTAGAGRTTDVDRWIASSSASFSAGERVPVWIGTDGNLNQIYENGAALETKVATRLGLAINAVMCSDDPDNTYWNGTRPTPWLMARSGQSFDTGTLVINLVDNPSGAVNFQHSGLTSDIEVFVNNLSVAASTDAASEIRLFNSRLVRSYANFPEIFDNPFTAAGLSDSVIDVNPADGQEITAMIPFFGQSAFGSANLTQAVVVFKTNSVYLVDVRSGQIQRLQTQGQGCTAPRSVSSTQDGIMFANEAGIWKLGWDMRIQWVGRLAHDLWDDDLDLTKIAEFAGHNYRQDRKYKLSVVPTGSSYPTNVLVYDHAREQMGQQGSWSEYTNHTATGWANQSSNAFFGTQSGRVMKIRNAGDLTDYRDDASPIAEQKLITGGVHYGLPGNRKTTSAVTIQYKNDSTLTDINVSTEQSLSGTFNASTQVDISEENQTVRYSLAERKGTFLRVQLTKSGTKDEKMTVSRLTFHTKDIGDAGVREAADLS